MGWGGTNGTNRTDGTNGTRGSDAGTSLGFENVEGKGRGRGSGELFELSDGVGVAEKLLVCSRLANYWNYLMELEEDAGGESASTVPREAWW